MDAGFRPVFFEELDILGLSDYWNYSMTDRPLLWARGRKYFYKGKEVMKANGGNIFSSPQVVVKESGIEIVPDDNEKDISGIVYKTIDLIASTIEKHKNEYDAVVVSFSGGKDSTVVLDLVSRAIPPDEFIVVFNDTTMELSTTYEAVEQAKKRYPNLSFYTTKSKMNAVEAWRLYGPPNRFNRWCHVEYKSKLTVELVKDVVGNAGRVLVVTGTRRFESSSRLRYSVLDELKGRENQTNFNAMLDWTAEDVWQYILQRGLFINKAYRYGMRRVGCALCPFLSDWDAFVLGHVFYKEIKPFLEILVEYAVAKGIKDVRDFIAGGKWRSKVLKP